MDPLSIPAGCVGLIAVVTKALLTVAKFVREVGDAQRDLDAVSQELLTLKTVLELLGKDTVGEKNKALPDALRIQICDILTNCKSVVLEIEHCFEKHAKSKLGRRGYWTLAGGKEDMAKLRSTLKAHNLALDIALSMVTITMTRDIKEDTAKIVNDMADLKDKMAQILKELERLQAELAVITPARKLNSMPQRFLDKHNLYADPAPSSVPDDLWDQQLPTYEESVYHLTPSHPGSGQLSLSRFPTSAQTHMNKRQNKPDAHYNVSSQGSTNKLFRKAFVLALGIALSFTKASSGPVRSSSSSLAYRRPETPVPSSFRASLRDRLRLALRNLSDP